MGQAQNCPRNPDCAVCDKVNYETNFSENRLTLFVFVQPNRDQSLADQPGFHRPPPDGGQLGASSTWPVNDCLPKLLLRQSEKIFGKTWLGLSWTAEGIAPRAALEGSGGPVVLRLWMTASTCTRKLGQTGKILPFGSQNRAKAHRFSWSVSTLVGPSIIPACRLFL